MELLQYTTALPRGSGRRNACGPIALGQWTVELSRYTTALPWGNGWWNSYGTLPHRVGGGGQGTAVLHCLIALG